MLLGHGYRAYLGQVLPHHVQRTATRDFAIRGTGHPELLDVLIQRHGRLVEQPARPGVGVDQRPDDPDIARPGTSDRIVHPLSAFAMAPSSRWAYRGNQGGPPGCQHPKRSWAPPIRPATESYRAGTCCCSLPVLPLIERRSRADHASHLDRDTPSDLRLREWTAMNVDYVTESVLVAQAICRGLPGTSPHKIFGVLARD